MTNKIVTRDAINFVNAIPHNEMLGTKVRAFRTASSFVTCEIEDSAPDRNGFLVILKDLDNEGLRYKGLVFGEVSPVAIILGTIDDDINVIKDYKGWILENLTEPQKGFKTGIRIEFSDEVKKTFSEAKASLSALFGNKKLPKDSLTKFSPFEKKTTANGWTKVEIDEAMVVFIVKKLVKSTERFAPVISLFTTNSIFDAIKGDSKELDAFAEDRARAIKAADKKKK